MMRSRTLQSRSTDLTADDLEAIKRSLSVAAQCWLLRATRAPSPDTRSNATLWAHLVWIGPASEDVGPSVAITCRTSGYAVTILDPLEILASGAFETVKCPDIRTVATLIRAITDEVYEVALDSSTTAPPICEQNRKESCSVTSNRTPNVCTSH
jgi:hypothetical protein